MQWLAHARARKRRRRLGRVVGALLGFIVTTTSAPPSARAFISEEAVAAGVLLFTAHITVLGAGTITMGTTAVRLAVDRPSKGWGIAGCVLGGLNVVGGVAALAYPTDEGWVKGIGAAHLTLGAANIALGVANVVLEPDPEPDPDSAGLQLVIDGVVDVAGSPVPTVGLRFEL